MKDAGHKKYMLLNVLLLNAEPMVRRVVCVPRNTKFNKLHEIMQILFSWHNTSLHEFQTEIGDMGPSPDEDILPETKYTLEAVCSMEHRHVIYVYHLEENFLHDIEVLAPDVPNRSGQDVFCTAGNGANPFDDSDDLCAEFDFAAWPEILDLDAVNRKLKECFSGKNQSE